MSRSNQRSPIQLGPLLKRQRRKSGPDIENPNQNQGVSVENSKVAGGPFCEGRDAFGTEETGLRGGQTAC